MKNINQNMDSSLERLVKSLSGSHNAAGEAENITNPADRDLFYYFNNMNDFNTEKTEAVDQAWDKLRTRLEKDDLIPAEGKIMPVRFFRSVFKIAAVFALLISLSVTAYFITNRWLSDGSMITASAGENEKIMVELPDGSRVHINRNSEIEYPSRFRSELREVSINGEAFFDVVPNRDKPFVVEAGNARIRVTGTSFNVLTSNENNEVEVMVKSGQVILTDKNGGQEVVLDPDLIGTMGANEHYRYRNSDPNYLSWSTEILTYEGTPLEKTFSDLKRVHNIEVVAVDKSILDKRISTTFDRQSPQTIISIICTTFNLESEISNSIYYLSEK
ncbi:MAG: FecR domain-containing protein [Bacteroidales bacterium]|nr:FecR domain-containing protein [Bacteroidales bacterium]